MEIASDTCYAALSARDRRFDGLFYVGVTTTGVYCRPICPARLPRADRCEFYGTAAAAEIAGYRACLRCRPELAPGDASVDAASSIARSAARRIQRGALNTGSIDDLAASIGVTARHLRRTFQAELGVSPVEFAQTCRLGAAKRLLQDTALPMSTVAYAAGYGSVRRFNAAFRAKFARSPTDVRRARASTDGAVVVRLDFRPPLEWAALLTFLSGRAVPGVEAAGDGTYRRTLRIGEAFGTVDVRRASESTLSARVSVELAPHLMDVIARLRALFDLDARPAVISDFFAGDETLGELVAERPGLRVPGTADGFETAVRTILGQQVSVAGATTIAGRFAARFGTQKGAELYFPTRAALAAAAPADVQAVGMPARRAQTLIDLAASDVELAPGADHAQTVHDLQAISGIGPWTANYIAMRVLRWPDAYPVGDLVLERRGGSASNAEAWRPWRSYAAMYLWSKGD